MGAKHKKTRKEKIIADYRHQAYVLKNKEVPFDNFSLAIDINKNSESPYPNPHVSRDIIKTGILTCSIVVAQIILFFLLTRHIITLPIVKY